MSQDAKARALEELAQIEANAKRLQAVYDSPECAQGQRGTQQRIYKQLIAMWNYHDILRDRIAEEEFD